MPSENLHSEAAARKAALSCLRDEHRALARVVEALETITAAILEGESEPDFGLLASMLYYLDAVPERLHHPKEDRHLFARLLARAPESAALIERLQRDHQRSPQLVAELERRLVQWQGGAPDGPDAFALAVARYAEFTWNHMRTEEAEVLPAAERSLQDADWVALAESFRVPDDPLFVMPLGSEFDRLYQRIANLVPRRLRLSLLRPSARTPEA